MGSSSQQLYSLSWGEFGSSLTTAVQLLRGQGDLVDVTLAAGGRTFPAHKIVLSAASPFLLDLLKSTPCQHPVVMLAGIAAQDLESLLEFVYRGEVSVEPSQLPSLLQAAHCLSIHGLTPPTILSENGQEIPASAIPRNTEPLTRETMNSSIPMQRRKKRRKSSSSSSLSSSGKWPRGNDNGERGGHEVHHGDERRTGDYDHNKDTESGGGGGGGSGGGSHDDTGDGSKGRSISDQPTTCPLCGAILRQSRNLRRHLELLHFGMGNSGKPTAGVRVHHRKSDRLTEFHRQRVPHGLRIIDHPHQLRTSESSDFSSPASLSLASTSGTANPSLPGNLLASGSMLGGQQQQQQPQQQQQQQPQQPQQQDQSLHTISGITSSASCGSTIPGTLNNSIYSSDSSASVLSCLLPNLQSLPSLPSPHDVFLHGEMLRAGMAYHDTTRQHTRHMQRTDVT